VPNSEPLKVGQTVFLKQPRQVYAKVTGRRRADLGLPEEQAWYDVELIPRKQKCQREELELTDPLPPEIGHLLYLSPEWIEELGGLNDRVGVWCGNRDDQDLLKEVTASMIRLGFPV
jgi:hypothetical protein